MNIDGFKGFERCDENALNRWENEGGCVGVRPQHRIAARYSSRRDFAALRNGRVEVAKSPSGKNLEHGYGAGGRLPRRGKERFAATVGA